MSAGACSLIAKMGENPLKRDAVGEPTAGQIMAGVLALLAADRDERAEDLPVRKSELVLAEAGFNAQEIAALTGKNKEAVRSALRRSQPKKASPR